MIVLEGKPIGYVVLCFGYSIESLGRDAVIDERFIVDEYRNYGIGKKALEYVMSKAKAIGMRTLYLEVGRDNRRAQRLYKSVGFRARERFFLMEANLSTD